MADISKITLPSGSTYDLKDATARELIDDLSSYSSYLGVTTTELTDGSNAATVTIDGEEVTPVVGSIVNYGSAEFIYNGSVWQEFGDLSALGALAYKDSATGTVTAAGTVSAPTFTGTTASYTPEGTIEVEAVTAEGTVAVDDYTPEGSVSAPTITTTPTTTNVTSVSDVGTLPSATMPTLTTTVADETLTIAWTDGTFDAGSLPTLDEATAVMTSVDVSASVPTFTGTTGSITAAFTGASVTPTATFTGIEGSIAVDGEISAPVFTGTAVDVTVS